MGPVELVILVVVGGLIAMAGMAVRGNRPDPVPNLMGLAGRFVRRAWLPLSLFFIPVLLAATTHHPDDSVLVFWAISAAVGLLIAWVREFAFLMRQGDDAFPGRNDKLIWALVLIVLPPLGVLAFWSFRRAHWPAAKPVGVGPAADLY